MTKSKYLTVDGCKLLITSKSKDSDRYELSGQGLIDYIKFNAWFSTYSRFKLNDSYFFIEKVSLKYSKFNDVLFNMIIRKYVDENK